MRKRKRVIGKSMIEVTDYHTSRTYRRNGKRVKKQQPTSEAVKKNNEKAAEARLRMLIDINFKSNDYYLTLTYKEQPTWEQAKKDMQNFIKRLQRAYKKCGKELKYIYVAEGKTRIHFHMIINSEIELYAEDFAKLWKHGMHKLMLFNGQAEDACRLAHYFVKEKRAACYEEKQEVFHRRWSSSKNLEKPSVKVETLKASTWREGINAPQGYYIETDSVVEGVSEEGYPYRFYRLIKIGEKNAHTNYRNGNRWNMRNVNNCIMRS